MNYVNWNLIIDGQTVSEVEEIIGDRVYDFNEVVSDGETITESINKISTYIHNEDYSEYRNYSGWQNISKVSGQILYNITQDENCTTPIPISDYSKIVSDLLYFDVVSQITGQPVYKEGSVINTLANRVKVVNYNNTNGQITLNFAPKENFRVIYSIAYNNVSVPIGKIIDVENGEVIISGVDEASEIQYDNSTSLIPSTTVQGALDYLGGLKLYAMIGSVINTGNTNVVDLFDGGVGSRIIKANTLRAGDVIKIEFANLLSSGNGQSSTVTFRIGGQTLISNNATLPNGLNNNLFNGAVHIVIKSIGVNGTCSITGMSIVAQNNLSALLRSYNNTALTTINTTVDNLIELNYRFTTLHASNSITSLHAHILKL